MSQSGKGQSVETDPLPAHLSFPPHDAIVCALVWQLFTLLFRKQPPPPKKNSATHHCPASNAPCKTILAGDIRPRSRDACYCTVCISVLIGAIVIFFVKGEKSSTRGEQHRALYAAVAAACEPSSPSPSSCSHLKFVLAQTAVYSHSLYCKRDRRIHILFFSTYNAADYSLWLLMLISVSIRSKKKNSCTKGQTMFGNPWFHFIIPFECRVDFTCTFLAIKSLNHSNMVRRGERGGEMLSARGHFRNMKCASLSPSAFILASSSLVTTFRT